MPPWSLDQLVGTQPNRWGYGKTERLGGLEVHDHLKFCRQLNESSASFSPRRMRST
jgi:hypothetical protein